jgi:hypothetical protein
MNKKSAKKAAKRKKRVPARTEARAIFENLAEQEKIKGHHSNEGLAIRLLSRGLSGWLSRTLSARDVYILCDETLEQWLRSRLTDSPWSSLQFTDLVARAFLGGWITELEVTRIVFVRAMRKRVTAAEIRPPESEVVATLRNSIKVVENYW